MDREKLAHDMEDCSTDLSNMQLQVAAIAVVADKLDGENLKELSPTISTEALSIYGKLTNIKQRLEEIKWQMLELKK